MEKKEYIKPSVEVIEMDVMSMLAASVGVSDETTDEGAWMSNRHRGEWGNLWSDDKK